MSRFEPNVEPSMEEILASIRRIIAEDTSGSRTAPPVPPASPTSLPRAGANPAAAPQRGFMSREAFLRSSAPGGEEPGNQRYFTPVSPHDPQPGAEPQADKSQSSSIESKKADAEPALAGPSIEPVKSADHRAAENPERKVREDIEGKVTDEAERRLRPSPTPADTKSETEAETVNAQLVELLGEDIKALRDAEKRDLTKPEIEQKSEVESASVERAEPADSTPQKQTPEPAVKPDPLPARPADPSVAEEPLKGPESQANNDPFAFDLGPSPFSPRATVERPAERHISIGPAPVHARPSEPPHHEAAAYGERGHQRINGSTLSSEPVRPTAPPPKSYEPAPRASTSSPPPAPTRAAPSFAVPSVSATLGPHRRLEPLSESFKPAPATSRDNPDTIQADPFSRRDYVRNADIAPEPRQDRFDAMLQPSAPIPPASPSLLDTTASLVGNGDRTMEDAVADLLRPLLKTWLAENMPKIVERALRREMTERLLPGQKNSRD